MKNGFVFMMFVFIGLKRNSCKSESIGINFLYFRLGISIRIVEKNMGNFVYFVSWGDLDLLF